MSEKEFPENVPSGDDLALSSRSRNHLPIPEQEGRESFGIIMVKPHAFKEVSDIVIGHFLNSPDSEAIKQLGLSRDVVVRLPHLEVCKSLIKDFSDGSPTSDRLLDIFYGEDRDKKHYPTLLDAYKAGTVAIFLLRYRGSRNDLHEILHELKGKEGLVGSNSSEVQKGKGFRGVLSKPREAIDLGKLEKLGKEEYQRAIMQIINNVLHTTVEEREIAEALRILLRDGDIEEMGKRGIKIRPFLDKYAPLSLV